MRRVALVFNPVGVDDPAPLTDALTSRCADLGGQPPLVLETTADDPGSGQTREALAAGVDLVLVAGGDGTVRTVAETMLGSGVPLGVLPAGTGNLLARNLGLPLDLNEALELALTGEPRAVDAGSVDGSGAFVVMAGMGLDAAMMQEAPDALKAKIGWPAYLVGGARGLRRGRFTVHVTLDDQPPIRRKVSTVVVGNVGTLQGGLALLPEALPDDGLLDVALLAPDTGAQWLAVLGRLVLRRPPKPHDERMQRLRGRRVTVRTTHPRARQLDGDPIDEGTTLRAEVVPGGLLVIAPATGDTAPDTTPPDTTAEAPEESTLTGASTGPAAGASA